MRILHIIGTIDPAGGGPQEVVRMLLLYAPHGYTGEVVTLDDPGAAFLQTLPFTVHPLGSENGGWYSARLVPWLRSNRGRFDGVMLHGLWEFTALALLRTIAGRTPYVVFPHGMLDPYFKRTFPLKHLKKWGYWLPVQYWVLRQAHRVLFTSNAERDLAAQSFWLHRWNPIVVGLGSEAPPQDMDRCAAAFCSICPSIKGERYLLFLGRIDPKKGCNLLIDAFAAVSGQDPGLHLVVAGPDSGDWRTQLQAVAEEKGVASRIHWPGMLTGDAKWGAFGGCEAFVLPSHQENFGIAVVEALACGRPVLITKPINIAPDLATDGCAIVEEDTAAGVRALLTRWIVLSPETRISMGERALLSFAARYDMRKNTAVILQAFNSTGRSPATALAEAH